MIDQFIVLLTFFSNELILVLLFIAGFLSGVANAIAGGGTFFILPILLSQGIPPIVANATNAVSIFPGHAIAAYRDRKKLTYLGQINILLTLLIAITGGVIGATLLFFIDNKIFSYTISYLILFSTCLFAFGHYLNRIFKKLLVTHPFISRLIELICAIYGGFFGAGLGIMLMAVYMVLGVNNIQQNNALKNAIASLINLSAVIIFMVMGLVYWKFAVLIFFGAILGSYFGVSIARVLPNGWLKKIVISIGLGLSIYYFFKYNY